MTDDDGQYMRCMEVWGGSESTTQVVRLGGLDAWVYSKPYGNAGFGGDVYYASSCATGRINRLLLADVSGHGDSVAESAAGLRSLMRRYVNFLDQTKFVRALNRQFAAMSRQGRFATALATTFFAPSRVLTVCNAGHPPPLLYSVSTRAWSILEKPRGHEESASNIPLGILDITDYQQFDVELEVGDLVLCYTDALTESHDADGQMFGPEGLLRIVETVDAEAGDNFIQALLEKISARSAGNLSEDDVTVMLLRPSARPPRVRLRHKFGAMLRFTAAVFRSIDPRAERPPLPDFKLANIGGAIIPRLGKRWRPTCPVKASRPSR
ncbi:MAG: PP2C family protein-serine/threonine phosphatase [Tepidisphaeraceae bacterium]